MRNVTLSTQISKCLPNTVDIDKREKSKFLIVGWEKSAGKYW